jgi:ATP-binding cassette subfamily F protein uup
VLLVTHDRYFLDKVATSIVSFEGDGRVTRYEGNFTTYRTLKAQAQAAAAPAPAPRKAAPAATEAPRPARKPGKLSYKEQRELDGMEAAIEVAETRKSELETQLSSPGVFSNASKVAELQKELEAVTTEVDRLYTRWQELQNLQTGT